MSDSEIFQQMRQEKKARNKTKQLYASNDLSEFCEGAGLELITLHAWHFRIKGIHLAIDIFPTNKRYHDLKDNKRGGYRDLIRFAKFYFSKNDKPNANPK